MLNKLKRFTTSLLPIDPGRRGECNRCGACCKLPFPCPFLRFDDQGLSSCAVYLVRPPSCRKYPRIAAENLTPEQCGYHFMDAAEIGGTEPRLDPVGERI
jgi:Fe-S-cluster containining protein